jgi:hypothetical protein
MRIASWAFFLAGPQVAAPPFLAHDWIADSCRGVPARNAADVRATPVFRSRSGMNPTRGPHMNWLRLATTATLAGVLLTAGCASPCGCGGGSRWSFFRARGHCPCDCCSNCSGGGGVAAFGASNIVSDGPMLEPPGAPFAGMPPPAPPPTGLGGPGLGIAPSPLPPSLGAPLGTIPGDPGRFAAPMPNAATVIPAEPSSRTRR